MKYVKYFLVITCTLFVCSLDVFAARGSSCPTEEKKDLAVAASHVKVSYDTIDNSEIKELTIDGNTTTYKIPNYVFNITIYNLTEDLYADITTETGGNDERAFSVYYSDTSGGEYTFTDTNFGDIYNYTITVKSNKEKCMGNQLRTIRFTKPRYNAYSEFTYCQNSSIYYCQRFIKTELSFENADKFLASIKSNNDKHKPNKEQEDEKAEIKSLLKKNWRLYLIILLVIVGLVAGGIAILNRRLKNKEWKL